jgi:DNA helicase-2/ATP-dependent DNA helicase PcrA
LGLLYNFASYYNSKKQEVIDYLNDLNKAQYDAVVNINGPTLVIAGAGSGKTRVLTWRIAYLIEKGIKPYRILALTFTNKAASEMKNRIAALIGSEKVQTLWMGTFHSVFAKFLRKEAGTLGYPSSFTIYDTVDSKNVIKTIIKEMQLDEKIYKTNVVASRISSAKNNLITAEAYESNQQIRNDDKNSKKPELYRIYKIYQQRCFRSGAMDFDDLLLNMNILFRNHPKILNVYQQKFDYILVDEYQDTNFSQYLIIKKLSEITQNICVVGDDAQSIYSFRGAKIENILNFKNDYPDYKLFKLEQNYRSTKNIVNAANSVIEMNKDRIKKNVYSENETGNKVKIMQALTDNEEGFLVSKIITDSIQNDNTKYSDHAILYRTNAQSRIFEESLRKKNMPYKIFGGLSFYQRKEIKDLLAYFKLIVNEKDDESLKRVINYPKRGIGQSSIEKIELFANANNTSIWNIMANLNNLSIDIHTSARNQTGLFKLLINSFKDNLDRKDAYVLGKEIAEKSGILKDLFEDKSPEAIARYDNVQELLNGIKQFTEDKTQEGKIYLNNYLESVALLTNEDNEKKEDFNKVTLMTIHSAKGLEFRNVYIAGVEEQLFPSEMSSFSPKDLEEERRLFYVAVTRAEKELFITYASQRYKWGQPVDCTPSRFIKDIDKQFVEHISLFDTLNSNTSVSNQFNIFKDKEKEKTHVEKYNTGSQNSAIYNRKLKKIITEKSTGISGITNIKVGSTVNHSRFGIGTVINIEGELSDIKAHINFIDSGKKTLLLKYAKLDLIE